MSFTRTCTFIGGHRYRDAIRRSGELCWGVLKCMSCERLRCVPRMSAYALLSRIWTSPGWEGSRASGQGPGCGRISGLSRRLISASALDEIRASWPSRPNGLQGPWLSPGLQDADSRWCHRSAHCRRTPEEGTSSRLVSRLTRPPGPVGTAPPGPGGPRRCGATYWPRPP